MSHPREMSLRAQQGTILVFMLKNLFHSHISVLSYPNGGPQIVEDPLISRASHVRICLLLIPPTALEGKRK